MFIIYDNQLCPKLCRNNTASHSFGLFTRVCGHTFTGVERKKKKLFFLHIVPIGGTRFDGQEDLLHEPNENTIKAEKGKHRDYGVTRVKQ